MEDTQIKDVHEAIVACRGNLTAVANVLRMPRSKLQKYIESRPLLVEALDGVRDSVIDQAEEHIFSAVADGDLNACRFVLTSIGKKRGYTTANVQLGKDGSATEEPVSVIDELYAKLLKSSKEQIADVGQAGA